MRSCVAGLAATIVAVACGGRAPSDLGLDDVQNATYRSEWASSGAAKLRRGQYSEPSVAGSAGELRISLQRAELGDLTGDGVGDAAVVLAADPGGSGTFYTLHLLSSGPAGPIEIGSAFLGDRIILEGLAVEGRGVSVDLLERRPDDPMSAPPTVSTRHRFELRDGELVEVGSGRTARREWKGLEGFEWQLVAVRRPAAGAPVEVPTEDPPTLRFARESGGETGSARLAGFGGCNRFTGSYEMSGDRLSVSPLATTRMICPPRVMDIEDAFLPALQRASRYAIDDDRLAIRSGDVELEFRRGAVTDPL